MVPNYPGGTWVYLLLAALRGGAVSLQLFYFCMGMQRGRRPKIRFNNAAGFAHVLGFKMTAKTLDCTGKPRFGVGRLFSTRYGRLSG